MRFLFQFQSAFGPHSTYLPSSSLDSRHCERRNYSQNGTDAAEPLATRATKGSSITLTEYVAYLEKYHPATDKYMEYSGNSLDQVKAFQKKNPDYLYYKDFFDASISKHYYTAFPEEDQREDDGEASGTAISTVATKQILVVEAAHYQTLGSASFYATTT